MLCKGCSAGVLNHPLQEPSAFLMFQWACVWHDMKLVFRFTWQAGKTFVTTFWQLLQHFKPIPDYPVYSILTIPCKNINLLWLFPPLPPLFFLNVWERWDWLQTRMHVMLRTFTCFCWQRMFGRQSLWWWIWICSTPSCWLFLSEFPQ